MGKIDPDLWRRNVLGVVTHIADETFQKEAWFGKSKEFVSSPDEMYCLLIESYLLEDFLSSLDIGLSPIQKQLGEELRLRMEEFVDGCDKWDDPYVAIDHPLWEKVRMAARKFLSVVEQPVDKGSRTQMQAQSIRDSK